MTLSFPHPAGTGRRVTVSEGPALLSGITDGPGLDAHELRYGALPVLEVDDLVERVERVEVHGRGGAAFPFARKVATAADKLRSPVVVVNLSEGEPASLKDAALVALAPHLVLDGAAVTARALGAHDVHVVVPGESPVVGRAVRRALRARRRSRDRGRRLSWHLHEAAPWFVAGQSAAVLELMAGRPNLPVTTWRPTAEAGHRGRPTVLSNAETYAHVAHLVLVGEAGYRAHGTSSEPGTTLLTLDGDLDSDRPPAVVEVAFGTPWSDVLDRQRLEGPLLLGGYHGSWLSEGQLTRMPVSREELRAVGVSLGAGVVLPLDSGCPVERTTAIVGYLATQSAGRCGPCHNGLPALAATLAAICDGRASRECVHELGRLAGLVERRGACAHPDGTVRLVRSLLTTYGDEVEAHAQGTCAYDGTLTPAGAA